MPSKTRKVIETLFRIYDKNGDLVDFILNDIQARIDEEIILPIEQFREVHGHNAPIPQHLQEAIRASILKYRQGGVTTLVMAWFLVDCMAKYTVSVMLTHDRDHSEKLLYRARLMLKNLKGPAPKTNKLNDNEISFAKTDSVFYIGTAGSKEFGRSATITNLHCSEIAFWKDPASLMKSLFQAVPKHTGVIIQETTANGWGNWFQKSFYTYLSGKGGFKPFFFAWFIHNEYVSAVPWTREWDLGDYTEYKTNNVVTRVPNEKSLYRRIRRYNPLWTRDYILTKLQWRREKIFENLGDKSFRDALRDFNQEYPSTVEEAFTMSGGSLFGNVRAISSPAWIHSGANAMRLVSHPRRGMEYALGADFSGGTGNDNSTINVFCLETREQVYRFADSYIDPIAFAELVCEVGTEFNTALLVPEINAHGLAGMVIIKRKYDLLRIYKHIINKGFSNAQMNIPTHGYGWRTSQTSKFFMVGIAQQFFNAGWKIYDPMTEDELRAFTEDPETGKLEGQGSHDDVAIATFLAFIGILKLYRLKGVFIQDFDDETEGTVVVDEVLKIEQPKTIETTWRNEEGQCLIQFKDLFGKKHGKRSAHA